MQSDAKSRHHFVENEQRTVAGTQFAQALQKPGQRCDEIHVAGHRLDDDAGNVIPRFAKQCFELVGVVVRKHQRLRRGFGRHAGRTWIPQRQGSGSCLDQQAVDVAVITTLEFHDAGFAR